MENNLFVTCKYLTETDNYDHTETIIVNIFQLKCLRKALIQLAILILPNQLNLYSALSMFNIL